MPTPILFPALPSSTPAAAPFRGAAAPARPLAYDAVARPLPNAYDSTASPGGLRRKVSRAIRAYLSAMPFAAPLWSQGSYESYVREGYMANPYVYRAIDLLAGCMAGLPLVLFDYDSKGDGTKIPSRSDHPLWKLLRRPCPVISLEGRRRFMACHFAYFLISGNAYMEKVGPRNGPPKELWTHRPDWMRVLLGTPYDPIAGYEFTAKGPAAAAGPRESQTFPFERIFHQKSFHALDPWYGMSPISAGSRSIDQHNQSKAWNMGMLTNASMPSGVFTVEEGTYLNDDEMLELRALIAEHYQGGRNAGRPLLLEAGLKWQQMSLTPADMAWLEGQHLSADEIFMIYGIPPQLKSAQAGDVPTGDLSAIYEFFYTSTVIPAVEKFLEGFNAFVTADFGEGLMLRIDMDRVPALAPSRNKLWATIGGATFLEENEKRQMLGFEPKEWGDVRVFPSSMVQVDEDGNLTALLPMSGTTPPNDPATKPPGNGARVNNGGGRPRNPTAKRPAKGAPAGTPEGGSVGESLDRLRALFPDSGFPDSGSPDSGDGEPDGEPDGDPTGGGET